MGAVDIGRRQALPKGASDIVWMTDYINAIKRGFRDQHGFIPDRGTDNEPLFDHIPDGEYPMMIDGKLDRVRIEDGTIKCCRFDEMEGR